MTTADGQEGATGSEKSARSILGPALKIGAVIFALVLGAIAVTAWVSGEDETLPFDYEGFD